MPVARGVKEVEVMPWPIPLPVVSRGFASLTRGAREEGERAAAGAAAALAAVLGAEVRIAGRCVPGRPRTPVGMARVDIALEGLGADALLRIEAGLLSRTLARLAGGAAAVVATPALRAEPLEQALLELLALVAIDGARSPRVDTLLPRLAAGGAGAPDGLVVALDLTLGQDRGAGELVLPPRAVAALADRGAPPPGAAGVSLGAAFRQGTSSLTPDELRELAPGDVALLDPGDPPAEIALPGGLALRGRAEGAAFHVQEILMTQTQAAFPITLAVELGRVTLTLADLARLEPGAAIPLDLRKDGAVVLRAGERAVARGELVEIDGALGVRVAQVGDLP